MRQRKKTLPEEEKIGIIAIGIIVKTATNAQRSNPMFQFRLNPLITIRDNKLKERQRELAQAFDARRILEEELQKIDHQLEQGIVAVRALMQPGQTVNVQGLIGFRREEMFLRAGREDLMEKIKMVDAEIEIRRSKVIAANKELKVIEKLKEKRYEHYLEEANKADIKTMDEIAGNRHAY